MSDYRPTATSLTRTLPAAAGTAHSAARATPRPSAPFRVGLAVRERRIALGLSQVELAARARMTRPALSRLEAGSVIPTIPLLERISAALDADLIVQISPHAAGAEQRADAAL